MNNNYKQINICMVNVFMLACPSCLFINYAASAIYWLKIVLWGKVFKQLKSPKWSYFAYVHWVPYTLDFSLVGYLVGFCFSWCLFCSLSMKTICKLQSLKSTLLQNISRTTIHGLQGLKHSTLYCNVTSQFCSLKNFCLCHR